MEIDGHGYVIFCLMLRVLPDGRAIIVTTLRLSQVLDIGYTHGVTKPNT